MKRMTFIGSMLLALLFTTAVAGLALAQDQATPSADTHTFDYPVTLQGRSIGTVTIDTKLQTFKFAGEGLRPGQEYDLMCTQVKRSLGSAKATKRGTLRMKGKWDPLFWEGLTEPPPTFVLTGQTMRSVGCEPTELYLLEYNNWGFWDKVEGYLVNNMVPLRNMQIRIVKNYYPPFVVMPYTSTWYATTDDHGYFSYVRLFTYSDPYRPTVYFDGNSSYCSTHAIPPLE